jgi:hypothetical protein
MSTFSKRITRVQVEVDGYVWRVHGRQHGLRWHSHLVELLGPLPLDRPISQPLRDKIRTALAKALALDESEVAGIPEDLILA